MSDNEFRQFGDYKLEFLRLISYNGNESEIANIIDEVNIHESLFDSSISGSVRIIDANNLIKNLPIVGHELLEMGYRTKGVPDVVEQYFYIYKVGSREQVSEKTIAYTLYFTTEENVKNALTQISKAVDGSIHEMVETIFDEIDTKKPKDIEETTGTENFIIPMWSPFQTLTWLSSRAVGDQKQSDYVFYETAFGYRFKSITTLSKQKPFKKYKYQHTMNVELRQSGDAILSTITKYQFGPSFDTLKNTVTGGYGSHALVHDITTKRFEWNEYDYKKDTTSTFDGDHPILPTNLDFPTNGNISFEPIQSQNRNNNNFNVSNKQHRKSTLSLLTNCDLSITVSGDSRMEAGMMVEVEIPSPEPYADKLITEEYLGGKRLITAINHQFTKTKYFMHMELSKNSVAEEI